MIDGKEIIKVTNRDNGSVGYTIPDLRLYREFAAGETKDITMEELRKLSYIPGGKVILQDYLVLNNKDAVYELLNEVEPEYFYTEADVKNLLMTGSLDALKDCLDYAPAGTIDLVKKVAVDIKLNDIQKREAIQEMTGFNVTSAIAINEATAEEKANEDKGGIRRVTETKATEETKPAGRRTTPTLSDDKYKNVIIK